MSGPCFVCGKPRERISPLCDTCKEQRQRADIDAAACPAPQTPRRLPSEELIEIAAKLKR
jgi:hypothetical protein